MKLKFKPDQIYEIAQRYDRTFDKELELMQKTIKNQRFLNKAQLEKIGKWKSPRSVWHIGKNANDFVEEITKFSFSTTNERAKIEVLTTLDGVSWPTASVILHWFSGAPYPILDYRALWSCSVINMTSYNFSFWKKYTEFCRDIALNQNVDMRTLDRALWQFSKENQKSS